MAAEIVMPKLSDTMEEGRIIKWLKEVGEPVKEGEPLLEVETDKADIEVEAFDTGILIEITADEGETIKVGQKIGLIGTEVEAKGIARPPAAEKKEARKVERKAPAAEAPEKKPEEKKGKGKKQRNRQERERGGKRRLRESPRFASIWRRVRHWTNLWLAVRQREWLFRLWRASWHRNTG